MLAVAIGLSVIGHALLEDTNTLIWSSLVLSITGLVCVEQLYKNTNQLRLIKLWCLTIGAIFVYDIYLFSYSLIFNQVSIELWQARGAINGACALLMALGSLALAQQGRQWAQFTMSRPVAFYTASLTAAGGFLTIMAVGGYYVQLYGGEWGTIVQIILLFLALLSVTVVFISHTARSRLNVWINKNFFRHKYDYRVEWLRLINSLSRPSDAKDFNRLALSTVASIFKSPGGAIWLQNQEQFQPVATFNLDISSNGDFNEWSDTDFCRALRDHEWVFSPYAPASDDTSALNECLPCWIYNIPKLWLVLPLLTEKKLLGFIVLIEPEHDTSLTWEDLDLLKTVGRQVASYIDRHLAAEQLAEAKQFDAFNKFAAFMMHDLKNLIAQQALVVDNAAKHKDNPAFVEDAIHTIDNSVRRMSALLKKLQQNEPGELRTLEINDILVETVKRCQDDKPVPSLRLPDKPLLVNADLDQLIMTLHHIIKNAQEATDNSGFVDITLRQQGNDAIITIEDNGEGMDEEFIQNQLFKPFVTTKSGKGMGIGVYQTQEYIRSLGGSVAVESTLGAGSTFTVSVPCSAS